ncbi:hypothetical protein ML8HA_01956 [Lactococcus lactis]|nr:hypothetical protein [Lactococcus lactis]
MKKTNYDSGYGGQEIAYNLMIKGNGFIMTRGEYDGSEWWIICKQTRLYRK